MRIDVRTEELVAIVHKHKAEFQTEYQQACAAWADAVASLARELSDAVAGGTLSPAFVTHKHQKVLNTPPVDRTDEYDKLVAKLRRHAGNTIQLDDHEYDCFVLDEWNWVRNAKAINSGYAQSRGRGR